MAESTRQINFTPDDVNNGKTMAILAYLVFFIPLLMDDMKNNNFVMYHTEQAIVLLIFNVIAGVIGGITCGIGLILYLPWLVFLIMGIMNASKGECKPLPLIGKFGEKFNLAK
ncbi:MAG: hypothetical protein IT280_06075 [Ignavibacteria bacterium]|nr:hypothetical protein [Ignavibacteria bacterium]